MEARRRSRDEVSKEKKKPAKAGLAAARRKVGPPKAQAVKKAAAG